MTGSQALDACAAAIALNRVEAILELMVFQAETKVSSVGENLTDGYDNNRRLTPSPQFFFR